MVLSRVSVTKIRRGFGLVNRFIGSSLVVTAISSYTFKNSVTRAYSVSNVC
jgi:hypothetical protein